MKRHTEDLPHPLSAEELAKGQAFPLENLLQFYRVLYTSFFSKNVQNKRRMQRTILCKTEAEFSRGNAAVK